MEQRFIYSDFSIRKFYNHLVLKQKNKVPFEYEIRVDGDKVIPRTNDLSIFHNFRDFVMSQTANIEILLYKGTSRTYDKYIFEISGKETSIVDIDKIVAERLEVYKKEQEFIRMTEKLEEYKTKNEVLKERIRELGAEAKNSDSMKDLITILSQSGVLSKLTNNNVINESGGQDKENKPSVLEGYTNEQLIDVLNLYKGKLGDERFQTLLGSCMQMGEHPEIIPLVKQLIEEHINKSKQP